jgi:hypothetical protein
VLVIYIIEVATLIEEMYSTRKFQETMGEPRWKVIWFRSLGESVLAQPEMER